ncbi:MAG: hypothetical protein WA376_02065, partial [Terrimicrobiaceae bacterium]
AYHLRHGRWIERRSLKALGHKPSIRKGRSLGLAACYGVIDRLSGHLCVSRLAHETVIKIYEGSQGYTPRSGIWGSS